MKLYVDVTNTIRADGLDWEAILAKVSPLLLVGSVVTHVMFTTLMTLDGSSVPVYLMVE